MEKVNADVTITQVRELQASLFPICTKGNEEKQFFLHLKNYYFLLKYILHTVGRKITYLYTNHISTTYIV